MCFRCLLKEHIVRDCKENVKCAVCSANHITLLHTDNPAAARQQLLQTVLPVARQPSGQSEETGIKARLCEMSATAAPFTPLPLAPLVPASMSTVPSQVSVSVVEVMRGQQDADPSGHPRKCSRSPYTRIRHGEVPMERMTKKGISLHPILAVQGFPSLLFSSEKLLLTSLSSVL